MTALKTRLIVISAPSGAGKSTLCEKLLKDFADRLVLSISTTTRAPRGKEKNGVEYFFVTKQDFERGIQQHRFAEWAQVHGNYYGTSKEVIEKCFREGKSVLLDIDVQGAASLKKTYPRECFRVFIAPPSLEQLESRLRLRGTDSEETIQRRLKNARDEMEHAPGFDRIVVNDQLESAYEELKAIVTRAISADGAGGSPDSSSNSSPKGSPKDSKETGAHG